LVVLSQKRLRLFRDLDRQHARRNRVEIRFDFTNLYAIAQFECIATPATYTASLHKEMSLNSRFSVLVCRLS
jgi:hypothetical protein